MAYDSADIAAFKNVWVFCEQRQGKMMPTTFELISEGRKLADELGVELCGILLGDDVGDNVQVVSGLEDGAQVILDQIDRLQDGRAVAVQEGDV